MSIPRYVGSISEYCSGSLETPATKVVLRLVGNPEPDSREETPSLLSLIPLKRPGIPVSEAQKLRIKDGLAGGSARINAGLLARNPLFWDYLQQISLSAYDREIDSRRARMFINRVCDVNGRYDLERNEVAVQRFFSLIEAPFLEWLLTAD